MDFDSVLAEFGRTCYMCCSDDVPSCAGNLVVSDFGTHMIGFGNESVLLVGKMCCCGIHLHLIY